ncbi:low molecular weight protein-tyrosine-phosphatase [Pseudomonas abieticivorans]|uniref:low molecular weight protein-tyrosine-phosphatase n=1 Tax=Pseudomonas abieticivorans TaxID=2931382 RepID=UPI0020BF4C15|nr:low molecular weight protein-tyrosine-phosphatase [Pseudomonas sp. PIA16]
MLNKVLIICVGNICRSPMAAALLRHRSNGCVQVTSAGVQASSGAYMDPMAKAVLKDFKIKSGEHRACQVTRDMLHWADLVLLMEQQQLKRVVELAPEVRGKVFLIGKWQNDLPIADPFRRPKNAFQQTYAQLARCVDDWLPHLSQEDQQK